MTILNERHDFVAIDASTASMAFSVFRNGSLSQHGKVKFNGDDIYEKIVDISHKTAGFFKLIEGIDHMVIEQVIYVNSPKTAAHLAMAHGALVSAASQSGIEHISSVSPMVWQNWIGNKKLSPEEKEVIKTKNPGKSASWYKSQELLFRKQRTIGIVNSRFGVQISDDDVADAVGVGSFALDNWGKVF